MKLASYNVENLFDRPKILNLENWDEGKEVLEDYKTLSDIVQHETYTEGDKAAILEIMGKYKGLLSNGESRYILLRDNKGKLIRKNKDKTYEVVANGRADWIGWFELVTEEIKETATENTARIIQLVSPDVLAVIEAEDRIGLKRFNENVLPRIGCDPFGHVMLIDGNDDRGIDVGVMSRPACEIVNMRSHIDDTDGDGVIFSRDCAEYEFATEKGNKLLLLVNHFKSKGYGDSDASDAKRLRQASRVRKIVEERLAEGHRYLAVCGDLNDTPQSAPLAPLADTALGLVDIMAHARFVGDGRPGTWGNGTASGKLDYIFMSPALAEKVLGGGIERRGVWGGKNGDLFEHLPAMRSAKDAASDHAALWVELDV